MKKNMRPVETENVERLQGKVHFLRRSARRHAATAWGGSKGGARRKKTGQPQWFQQMKWERERKAYLVKLPVIILVQHGVCTEKQAATLDRNEIKTVWDLVDANYATLLKVPGFGEKTLAKLWQDAKIKGQLSMNWKPADGR